MGNKPKPGTPEYKEALARSQGEIKEDKSANRTYVERWNQYLIKIIFNPERDYINLRKSLLRGVEYTPRR